METLVAKKPAAAVKEDAKVLVIETIDQRPSNYVLDEANETTGSVYIQTSQFRKLLGKCTVMVWDPKEGEEGGWVPKKIRYLRQSKSIWVEDQERLNDAPARNPEIDAIYLEWGHLFVIRTANDRLKYDFLKLHENNASFTDEVVISGKRCMRPEGALDIFKEIDTESESEVAVDLFSEKLKAWNYLNTLKTKVSDTETRYNEDALQFLSNLFFLPRFSSGFRSETFEALLEEIDKDPLRFNNSIASKSKLVEADVSRGLQMSIVTIDTVRAFFSDSGMNIMSFPGHYTEDEKIGALIDFMSNPKNDQMYEQMRVETANKLIHSTEKQ